MVSGLFKIAYICAIGNERKLKYGNKSFPIKDGYFCIDDIFKKEMKEIQLSKLIFILCQYAKEVEE